MKTPDKDIENFWNKNPVGSNFIEYREGKEFYLTYDEFRYRTESHILGELDKIDVKNKRVLEIGLGQGADSMQIINRGAIYHGIDLTEESIKRLKERFQLFNSPYKEVIKANAQSIPYSDNYFDVVYSHGVIHHSPEIRSIVEEIYRVLKPDGRAVIMLYHKNSFNYYVSIALIRRAGLLLLFVFPFLIKVVSKLTGEGVERIDKHRQYFRMQGWSYLKMDHFIHRSTDGPDNIYSSVWTRNTSRKLFSSFRDISFRVHLLNERHLLGLQKLMPFKLKDWLSKKAGWHLWVFTRK